MGGRVLHHRKDVQGRPRALHRGSLLEQRGSDDQTPDHAGDEGRASSRHVERRTHRDATMPMKHGSGSRRGAGRPGAGGPKRGPHRGKPPAGRGKPPAGPGKPRAEAGARDEPQSFGPRKPKGSFGARSADARLALASVLVRPTVVVGVGCRARPAK